jgi:hypothetical protein
LTGSQRQKYTRMIEQFQENRCSNSRDLERWT